MFNDNTLLALSTCTTYFIQVALGYLITQGLCGLVESPRIRFKLWGCFLFLTVVAWAVFCLPTSSGGPFAPTIGTVPGADNRALWRSLPVHGSWADHLAWIRPWTWRLYFSISIIFFLELGWKSIRLRSFLRSGQPAPPEVSLLFQNLCREMKVSRCDLIVLDGLHSPATTCWWRPHVLLPTELVPFLDNSSLADVLRHELTHVASRHYLWDRLAAVGCRVVFFHPAVWFAHRHLRRERELVCDLAVAQRDEERRLHYAESLVKLVRWRFLARKNSPDTIGFFSAESMLMIRVRALLRETPPGSWLQRAARRGLVAVVATMAVCFLPRIGITLYWSLPLNSTIARSHLNNAPSRRHFVRRHTQKAVDSQASPSAPVPPLRTEVAVLFEHLSSPELPVLKSAAAVAPGAPDASPASAPAREDRSVAIASHPVWDEAPMSGSATRPTLQRATIDAINTGIGLATSGGESEDGQVGQEGNH